MGRWRRRLTHPAGAAEVSAGVLELWPSLELSQIDGRAGPICNSPPSSMGYMFQDYPGMSETMDNTKPYTVFFFPIHTFSLERNTFRCLFAISQSPLSLLLHLRLLEHKHLSAATFDLITKAATKWLTGRSVQCGYAAQRDGSRPRKDEVRQLAQDLTTLLRTVCNLKHELFTSEIFHFMFSSCSETKQSKTIDPGWCGGRLHFPPQPFTGPAERAWNLGRNTLWQVRSCLSHLLGGRWVSPAGPSAAGCAPGSAQTLPRN